MSGQPPVLVVGATQGTGHAVVEALLRDRLAVRVLARDMSKAARMFGDRVPVFPGDVTIPDQRLTRAVQGARAIIMTVGVTRRPAPEALVQATEHNGVLHIIAAARQAGFGGRVLHMSTIGLEQPSLGRWLLNTMKRNALHWRRRAIAAIAESGLRYTVVQAGRLTDEPGGRRPIALSQGELGLRLGRRISRGDVADLLVEALRRPEAENTTFNAIWKTGTGRQPWDEVFAPLRSSIAPEVRVGNSIDGHR